MGEHSVLHGSRCISLAINRRIYIEYQSRSDRKIGIRSSLGNFETPLDQPVVKPPFQFAAHSVLQHADSIAGGINLNVESEMPANLGLGTSGAVAVAACGAVRHLAGLDCTPGFIMDDAIAAVRIVQGSASGADCAASAFGGAIGYRNEPREIAKISATLPFILLYSGYKTPTAEVIGMVEQRRRLFPECFKRLDELANDVVSSAIEALDSRDWEQLGLLMDFNHGLLDAMGVNNPDLARIVHALRACPHIYGAKISGSGLGDCAIGLGHAKKLQTGEQQVNVQQSNKGVNFE